MKTRKWMFHVTDENGDSQSLKDFYLRVGVVYTGTYEEACNFALKCAEEWEKQLGGITKLVIEPYRII